MAKHTNFLSHVALTLIITCCCFHTLTAQWEYLGSPTQMKIVGFGSDDQYTYVASESGIYYSNDEGDTWNPLPNNTPFVTILSFKVIENKLYVMGTSFNRYDDLFVSEDGGLSWQKLQMTSTYGSFNQDWTVRGDTVMVAHGDWLLISYDGGMTPSMVRTLPNDVNYFNSIAWVGNAIVASAYPGKRTMRSTDFGATWTQEDFSYDFNVIQIGDALWKKSLSAAGGVVEIYKSEDDGQSFELKTTITGNYLIPVYLSGIGDEVYVLSTGGSKIKHTTDGGDTWTETPSTMTSFQQCYWNGTTLFSTDDVGVRTSSNGGGAWNAASLSPREGRIYGICTPGNGDVWANSFNTVVKSTDNGQNWTNFTATPLQSVASSGNSHMVGVSQKRVYISEDYGATWQLITTLNLIGTTNYATVLYLDGKFILYYAGQSNYVVTSSDGGFTWGISSILPGSVKKVDYNEGKFICHVHQTRIFASDNALNWQEITSNLSQLYLNNNVNGIFYADSTFFMFDYKIFRKHLPGDNWEASPYVTECCTSQYHSPKVEDFASYNGMLLAGVKGLGVFVSYDKGLSWLPFNDGLGNNRVYTLHISDGYLYAGLWNGGIWRRPISQLENYQLVKGHVFLDENENGVMDSNESLQPNITVRAREHGIFVQTDAAGAFTLYTNYAGADTIEVSPNNPYYMATTPGVEATGTASGLLFGVKFLPVYDASIDLTNVEMAQPGFDLNVNISGYYAGNTPSDLVVTLFPDLDLEFVESSPSATSVSSSSRTWLLPDVQPGEYYQITTTFYVPPSTPVGSFIPFTATVAPEGTDEHPQNNTAYLTLQTVNSYDPNDKSVFPQGDITPQMLADTLDCIYTIRFQNLGNYRADQVRIADTLSEMLDLNTLQVISASHDFSWQIRPGRVLEFNFPNILLPDAASDEPGSHGFVKYSIQALPDLQLGDAIQNTAHIYFDFNPAITTNRTENIVAEPTTSAPEAPETAGQIRVYPNPADQYVLLQVPKEVTLPAQAQLLDLTGRVYRRLDIQGYEPVRVDMSTLPGMLLYVRVQDGKRVWRAPVVKM